MVEQNPPLITISGPPGSGTTTLSEALQEEFDFEHISGGVIFRRMAEEREMTLAEFTELAEDDDSIDKQLDERLKQIVEEHVDGHRSPDDNGLIVESRLAGWHADGRADLAIWLDAAPDVRAERTDGRDETAEELVEREQSEADRYQEYYGIDINDLSVYDLVIDTETFSIDGMNQLVAGAVVDACGVGRD